MAAYILFRGQPNLSALTAFTNRLQGSAGTATTPPTEFLESRMNASVEAMDNSTQAFSDELRLLLRQTFALSIGPYHVSDLTNDVRRLFRRRSTGRYLVPHVR